jgi:parvulin-like peptidyl-prolyl isomerase
MSHFMRRHKLMIVWMLVLFVGIPMLFFGVEQGFISMFERVSGRGIYGDTPVASVYGTPISAQALYSELQRMAAQMPDATTEQLIESGLAQEALDRLINSAIIEKEVRDRNLVLTQDYIVDRLKQFPAFQNDQGEFDPRLWNSYVKAQRNQNWNELYASLEQEFARTLLIEKIGASARVRESEVRREFELAHTTIQVKYIQIDPAIEPTEEQLRETFDVDPDRYALPGAREAQFVEFPLILPPPPLALEIVEEARAGADFAALAAEHSASPTKESGGEVGWLTQISVMGTHREPVFDLELGAVSEPIEGPGGYFIYKLEDERTSELTQERDVFVREIMIAAAVSPEERAELQAQARELLETAKEAGSLEQAAADLGLALKTTGSFLPDAMAIDAVHRDDVFTFRNYTRTTEAGALVDEVIPGRRNLYVAQVTAVEEPQPRSFEEAREDVERDTIMRLRRSPERMQRLQQLASEIQIQADSIADIPVKFPEIDAEIRETGPFSMQDFLFQQGISLAARSIYDVVGNKEPGAFAGPLQGFDGSLYFVELSQKTLPDPTVWDEEYPEEKVAIRTRLEMMRQNARIQDYLKLVRDQSMADITTDYEVFAAVLGLNDPPEPDPDVPAAL